jgi:hypothetical protein
MAKFTYEPCVDPVSRLAPSQSGILRALGGEEIRGR